MPRKGDGAQNRLELTMLPVRIMVDPDDPDPEAVAGYFAAVLRRLDSHPEPMKISVEAPRGVSLDIDPADGAFLVRVAGRGVARRDFRRRWIAEHAVPLPLGATFLAVPTGGNRVRVRETLLSRLRRFVLRRSRALVYFLSCRRNGT